MRTVAFNDIVSAVEKLCVEANVILGEDVENALKRFEARETTSAARDVIAMLIENGRISRERSLPICQDTGMAVFFVDLGQEVYVNGSLTGAISQGVRQGYTNGFLRASVVADPLKRVNTGDNTPPVIHYDLVEGDRIRITFAPKGFGSENMSALAMLKPSDGQKGVEDFVVKTVRNAGSNPCPPVVVGVGLGGTMEKAAILAKKALTRDVGSSHSDPFYAAIEADLLNRVNALGIGPQGFGGETTALGVNIEVFPTHIAGLPAAVNISCHVTRHRSVTI